MKDEDAQNVPFIITVISHRSVSNLRTPASKMLYFKTKKRERSTDYKRRKKRQKFPKNEGGS